MKKSDYENKFMKYALEEAKIAFERGNTPVGAALVIDGKLIETERNRNNSLETWSAHAEASLIINYSVKIKSAKKDKKNVVLFTTWEPCFFCLGTSVLNRVDRIVYACPDPRGGVAHIQPEMIGAGYIKIWPKIEQRLEFREESYSLLMNHMNSMTPRWADMVKAFEEMHRNWKVS